MKKNWMLYVIIYIIIVLSAGIIFKLFTAIRKEYYYQKAVHQIENEEYYRARYTLKQANGKKYLNNIDDYIEETENFYRNTKYLMAYAQAWECYDDSDYSNTEKYLGYIPDDYSGEFAEDIKILKVETEESHKAYLENLERIRYESSIATPVPTIAPTPTPKPLSRMYSSNKSSKTKSDYKSNEGDGYDEGYYDVYMDGEPDWDRYDMDDDYAMGADDAMEEYELFGENW